ncbi:YtxH domain-containing protein [Gordonia jinghuaiqii]|uniref:YtxH domain-containing protein n=1 Tax=Gordonia jinghuaiqii TaxID=2758710 RepID=A0A7D7QYZ6_9ACTN|nr:YtxH domain-containing protein [Gordonia jinghuaiqii]MCR5977910.1 YtxH domain-containing protein [Gordonia jinghuaiqii]QMT02568.1 YtxH domain-containing protein [Gordonia jinghuaiqii]
MPHTVRAPDAFSRVAAVGVVPTVAVAAHGAASGAMPSSSGVVLSVAIGVVASMLLMTRRRRLVPAAASTTAVLTAAQVACHATLTVDAGHAVHAPSALSMLITHLLAIPLSAVLIVVGAHLLASVGSVIRSFVPPVTSRAPAAPRTFWTQPLLLAVPALGGTGVRGPPRGF